MKYLALLLFLASLFILGCSTKSKITSSAEKNTKQLLRVCPDEWYENKMPMVISDSAVEKQTTQYFIIAGERKELKDYDVEWIKLNCTTNKPNSIY